MAEGSNWIGHRSVTEAAVATFGQITGDYSRIHFDHELGRASPHGRGFAHGLLTASWALGALTLYAPDRLACGDPRAYPAGFRVRFHDVVRFGDTIALRCSDIAPDSPTPDWEQRCSDVEPDSPTPDWEQRCSEFVLGDGAGRTVASGAVEVRLGESDELPRAGEVVWPADVWDPQDGPTVWGAEDVFERGPRGAASVRTISEADVVHYCGFSGELNPLYVNAPFAERTRFKARIAPPMLCFSLGFSVWLRELLRVSLGGDESSAGHLGDRWQFVAPVHFGDTLELRHHPLALRRTRSQPNRGVATFGLQLLNQREEIVQQGEVDMLLPMREVAPQNQKEEQR